MGKTVTIRLTKELAIWLEQASKQSGVPKGRIVREQLEKARDGGKAPSFMRLAGSVHGVGRLPVAQGFSPSLRGIVTRVFWWRLRMPMTSIPSGQRNLRPE